MDPIQQEHLVEEELRAFMQALWFDYSRLSSDVRLVLQYIDSHLFEESLTVDDVLRQCHIRSHSFHARFKFELLGGGWGRMSIWEYVQRRRVEAAKWLLRHEELELFLIAVSIGFKHYETFARVFKRYTTKTPTAFRETQRRFVRAGRQGKSSEHIVRASRQGE